MIHYQQLVFGPSELRERSEKDDLSLLELTLLEGVAEFFGRVISGGVGNPLIHEYGALHERELWERFKADLNEFRVDGWFYQGDKAKDEPADLGYFIGSRIVEGVLGTRTGQETGVANAVDDHRPARDRKVLCNRHFNF